MFCLHTDPEFGQIQDQEISHVSQRLVLDI